MCHWAQRCGLSHRPKQVDRALETVGRGWLKLDDTGFWGEAYWYLLFTGLRGFRQVPFPLRISIADGGDDMPLAGP